MKKAFIIFLSVFGISCNNNSAPRVDYLVLSETLGNQATYKISVPDKVKKEDVIRIAWELKNSLIWDKEFVCFFYLKNSNVSYGAWATVSYLPRCPECSNDLDPRGNDIEYRFLGNK
jgi:hypothetical protein